MSEVLSPDSPSIERAGKPSPPIGFLERLPKWLICVPLVLQWLWLGLRYRSATLPSVANPGITAGGLVGEGKTEYFGTMGALGTAASARTRSFVVAGTADDPATAHLCLGEAQIAFPLIAKPDVGWCGYGVRCIESEADLGDYLRAFPAGERVVLQEYIAHDGEAGVFYARQPGAAQGSLIALAIRHFPQVTGDGQHTLKQLAAADPRTRRLLNDALHDFRAEADAVPPPGKMIRLATIGSTRVGGLYRDGAHLISSELIAAIDAIACEMDFYFGRFDLRYESESSLAKGMGFRIIEVNGAGSETIDAWDPDIGPLAAFARVFAKQRLLFKVAAANRSRGHVPIGVCQLAQLHLRQQRLIGRYPHSN